MKKIYIILIFAVLLNTTVVCFAHETQNDKYFLSSDGRNIFFLTQESTPEDFEDIVFTDKDGKSIENRKIYTGCYAQPDGESGQYQVVLTGDVNSDGMVNAADARLTIRASAKTELINDSLLFAAADTDCSDKITANDARKILRVSAKLDAFSDFEECFREKEEPSTEIDKFTVSAVLKSEYVNKQEECKEYFEDCEYIKGIIVFSTTDCEVGLEFSLTGTGAENFDATVEFIKNSGFFSAVYYHKD